MEAMVKINLQNSFSESWMVNDGQEWFMMIIYGWLFLILMVNVLVGFHDGC